ncbi:translocase subunit [Olea europaea subsp. europaea]|uniref:Translocase subunit n=1 Tax=Olea europaea subsp. europaea TaxID=158383 RepID=A0A8S0Q4T3_OLEEU|nr:translocase subunit [Olea europaea subsp. europaea]
MGFRALRSIIRPVCGSLLSTPTASHFFPATTSPSPLRQLRYLFGSFGCNLPWIPPSSAFHSLTDSRYPKRRPSDKPRRKRASLRPPGPYAWVKYVPGQPILPNQPNEGSVKRRNEKKRIKQHRAFILSEKKKRKAQFQEAKRKKNMQRVERKMAAVARERAWAQRLVELQQLEEKNKEAMV